MQRYFKKVNLIKIKFLTLKKFFFKPIEGCKTGKNYFFLARPKQSN
jgi:hypothetical protein